MSRVDAMDRAELLTRLTEALIERDDAIRSRDRAKILAEDLRRETESLRLFHLQMQELTPRVQGLPTDDQMIEAVKMWLVFYRQAAALCPHATTPGSVLDWIRIIKGKAAEWDKTVH